MVEWPSSFAGFAIVALRLGLTVRAGGLPYVGFVFQGVGIVLIGIVAYGIRRAIQVAVIVGETTVTILNPIRTYRIEITPLDRFRPTLLGGVYPYANGVALYLPDIDRRDGGRYRVIEILATGSLTEPEQTRLFKALAGLARRTGAQNEITSTWPSRW